ncbi:MAG: Fe-S cluster assembly protein SufD, partial [Microcystaceae cyanobacterium]
MSPSVIFKPEATEFDTDTYLSGLLRQCETKPLLIDTEVSKWLQSLRYQAASQVVHSKIPTKRDEEWRFTDLSELLQLKFQIADKLTVTTDVLEGFILPEAAHSRLVFVNGIYASELSDVSGLPSGMYIGNLANR